MPYEVRTRDVAPRYCVTKTDTNEIAKCHSLMEDAEAHRDALNIATSGEGNPIENRETEEEKRRRLARMRQRRSVRGYAEQCINRMLGR